MQEMQEMWVRSLDWKDPLEKGMATHSGILAWKIHGQKSLVGHSLWAHRVRHDCEHAHTLASAVETRPDGTGWKLYLMASREARPRTMPDYGLIPQVAECCAWTPGGGHLPPEGQLPEEPQSGEVSRQ